jgi:hypothetical protein
VRAADARRVKRRKVKEGEEEERRRDADTESWSE